MKGKSFLENYKYTIILLLIAFMIVGCMWIIFGQSDNKEKLYKGFKVEIVDVSTALIGNASETNKPIIEDNKITFNLKLHNVGDQAIYQINVKNAGTKNAVLESIKRNFVDNSDILYEFSEDTEGTVIDSGERSLIILAVTRIAKTQNIGNNEFTIELNYVATNATAASQDKDLIPGVVASAVQGKNVKGSIVNEIKTKGLKDLSIDYITGANVNDETDLPRYKELGFNIYENAENELIGKIDVDKITIYQNNEYGDTGYYLVGFTGYDNNNNKIHMVVTLYVIGENSGESFAYTCDNYSSNEYLYCGFNNYTMPLNANACDPNIYICE